MNQENLSQIEAGKIENQGVRGSGSRGVTVNSIAAVAVGVAALVAGAVSARGSTGADCPAAAVVGVVAPITVEAGTAGSTGAACPCAIAARARTVSTGSKNVEIDGSAGGAAKAGCVGTAVRGMLIGAGVRNSCALVGPVCRGRGRCGCGKEAAGCRRPLLSSVEATVEGIEGSRKAGTAVGRVPVSIV